jgi:hypothetical protein
MQVFDASSMIHAWDYYPEPQFPRLWNWIGVQIDQKSFTMARVAWEEVRNKTPDCGDWLKAKSLEQYDVNNTILQDSVRIKGLLGIVADNYNPKGVGENDILIIATARAYGAELVSEEQRQPNTPQLPAKRKIPLVCAMTDVAVPCINFIEYIKRSGEIFG